MTSLRLENVFYRIPMMERNILHDVSLCLNPNEFLVILGSNGSGKSSLLKCINGIIRPTSGHLRLDDQDFSRLSPEQIAKKVSTLGQSIDQSTFGALTVAENCMLVKKVSDNDLHQLLHECHPDLPNRLNTPTASLSGGQRQCLALALCILRKPKILLLDEHTSALDPRIAKEVMQITNTVFQNNRDLTLLMTTHSLDDALKYGNRLMIMRQGRCIFEASGEDKRRLSKEDLLKFYE